MRLVLLDISPKRCNFAPLSLCRPVWELRCGITTLAEKLIARLAATDVACFVPQYMAESYRARTAWPVNDAAALAGDDLLLVNGLARADSMAVAPQGPSECGFAADGELVYVRISQADVRRSGATGIEGLLDWARANLPRAKAQCMNWGYIWELVLASPKQITADFGQLGRRGVEEGVSGSATIVGSAKDVFIGKGSRIHPMVVIDATNGPVFIDTEVEIQPFTRIEGPCSVGHRSVLLGAKCREGNSIGPMCRIGGEVEESIFQGYSNKYHDGFIGHSYVGEWVNLGALTTNSDLRNDYGPVAVKLDSRGPIDTGSAKFGSVIGDHAKTSIGTLLNTGSFVGAMTLLVASGRLLPKHIPSFCSYVHGQITTYFGKDSLYDTASKALPRRGATWDAVQQRLWDAIYEQTAADRAGIAHKA